MMKQLRENMSEIVKMKRLKQQDVISEVVKSEPKDHLLLRDVDPPVDYFRVRTIRLIFS
jgi:hypothetical protein